MAFISTEIKIYETATTVPVQLYFPTDLPATVGNKVKGVITLLHGMGNTPSDWMQFSAAPRYAADNGYILVAPDAQASFYADMACGTPWYTILTEYLPAQLGRIFKIPTEREMNYIAGLSMGGYGAMRIGLAHPERYAAIGSFSGCLDMRRMAEESHLPGAPPILAPVLGPNFDLPPELDVMELLKKVAELPADQQPKLYCTCGLQDTELPNVKQQNETFRALAESLPVTYAFREWQGVHEWNFWDRSLAEFIGYIQGSDYGARKRADWS
ncbi:esterase family protein [Ruminococcaceae bacterium OttesenSCG-928-D13]|nr:esterase family protein [Ruminococcaceae bacterium OttesenSCG-928-D13]